MNIDISDRTYAELMAVLVGLIILVYGNGRRVQFSGLLKKGIRVEGEVIEIKTSTSSGQHRQLTYYPVIHFETLDSGPIAGDYDIFTSNPSAYKLWEKVPVVYDPDDHKNFMVDNRSSKLSVPIMMFGGIAIVIAAVIYYLLDPNSYIRF